MNPLVLIGYRPELISFENIQKHYTLPRTLLTPGIYHLAKHARQIKWVRRLSLDPFFAGRYSGQDFVFGTRIELGYTIDPDEGNPSHLCRTTNSVYQLLIMRIHHPDT